MVTASFSRIPGLARQEIGLLFSPSRFRRLHSERAASRQIGVCLAGAGMAVTHYSTAYATLFAVGTGYLIYAGLRASSRLRGRRQAREVVLTLPVVGVLAAVVWGWNVGITHSASNVSNFVTQASALGPYLLPNSKGGSLIGRWVNGMNPRPLTAANYQKVRPSTPDPSGDQPLPGDGHQPRSGVGWVRRRPARGGVALSVPAAVAADTKLIATVVSRSPLPGHMTRRDERRTAEFAAVVLGSSPLSPSARGAAIEA